MLEAYTRPSIVAGTSRAVIPPAAGDAGDAGDPAAGPDRDDEPLVVEGERLQRPALQLRVQVAGHRLALFQRDLRQRGQHEKPRPPAARATLTREGPVFTSHGSATQVANDF